MQIINLLFDIICRGRLGFFCKSWCHSSKKNWSSLKIICTLCIVCYFLARNSPKKLRWGLVSNEQLGILLDNGFWGTYIAHFFVVKREKNCVALLVNNHDIKKISDDTTNIESWLRETYEARVTLLCPLKKRYKQHFCGLRELIVRGCKRDMVIFSTRTFLRDMYLYSLFILYCKFFYLYDPCFFFRVGVPYGWTTMYDLPLYSRNLLLEEWWAEINWSSCSVIAKWYLKLGARKTIPLLSYKTGSHHTMRWLWKSRYVLWKKIQEISQNLEIGTCGKCVAYPSTEGFEIGMVVRIHFLCGINQQNKVKLCWNGGSNIFLRSHLMYQTNDDVDRLEENPAACWMCLLYICAARSQGTTVDVIYT